MAGPRSPAAPNTATRRAAPTRKTGPFAEFVLDAALAIERSQTSSELHLATQAAFSWAQAEIVACLMIRPTPVGLDVSAHGRTTATWRLECQASGLLAADPLIRHALTSVAPMSWSDIGDAPQPAGTGLEDALRRSRELGYREAFIAPQHQPGGAAGAVLIMSRTQTYSSDRERQALALLCAALHRTDRRLGAGRQSCDAIGPRLTRREAEALYWAASGAKDKEIALAMALSPVTVTGYVHTAQKKLGVRGRVLAARRAAELDLLPTFLSRAARRS